MASLVAALLAVPACGSTANDLKTAGITCTSKKTTLSGEIDGATYKQSFDTKIDSVVLDQGTNGTFDAAFDAGGALHLTWTGRIENGEEGPAKGSITLPGDAKAREASEATFSPSDEGARFVMTVTGGQLEGCVSASSSP